MVRQEYFFPKERSGDDEHATKRRETWRRNMDGKLRSRKHSAAVSEAGSDLPAHELAGLKLGRPDTGTKSAVNTPLLRPSVTGAGCHHPTPSTTMKSSYLCLAVALCLLMSHW